MISEGSCAINLPRSLWQMDACVSFTFCTLKEALATSRVVSRLWKNRICGLCSKCRGGMWKLRFVFFIYVTFQDQLCAVQLVAWRLEHLPMRFWEEFWGAASALHQEEAKICSGSQLLALHHSMGIFYWLLTKFLCVLRWTLSRYVAASVLLLPVVWKKCHLRSTLGL